MEKALGNQKEAKHDTEAKVFEYLSRSPAYQKSRRTKAAHLQKGIEKRHHKIRPDTRLSAKVLSKPTEQTQAPNDATKEAEMDCLPPCSVSKELCEFLGKAQGAEVKRYEATCFLKTYIREHGLEDPQDKRAIWPDAALTKLFKLSKDDKLSLNNLQLFLKPHFKKDAARINAVAEKAVEIKAATPACPVTPQTFFNNLMFRNEEFAKEKEQTRIREQRGDLEMNECCTSNSECFEARELMKPLQKIFKKNNAALTSPKSMLASGFSSISPFASVRSFQSLILSLALMSILIQYLIL